MALFGRKDPYETEEEPMQEMSDMDKVAEVLEKVVADINAIKQKIGMEESADEETEETEEEPKEESEVIEESEDSDEETKEDEPVDEPAVSETFNPGKIVFGENAKNTESFKEMVRKTMK